MEIGWAAFAYEILTPCGGSPGRNSQEKGARKKSFRGHFAHGNGFGTYDLGAGR